MSNPSSNPGYYYAEGDPVGTVRYWDGTQWTGEPMPPPPAGASIPGAPMAGTGFDRDRFGTVGVRIGAALLDLVITIVVALAVALPLVAADVVDSTTDATTGSGVNAASIAGALVMMAIQVGLIRQFGGTPGKLILGLRITEADGTTTPPALKTAAMRVIPIAIVTNIPILGFVAGVFVLVMSIVWVNGDTERRSVFDRVGETRVVYQTRL